MSSSPQQNQGGNGGGPTDGGSNPARGSAESGARHVGGLSYTFDPSTTNMVIAGILVPSITNIEARGGGITTKFVAEQLQKSGGQGSVGPEQSNTVSRETVKQATGIQHPPREITIQAYTTNVIYDQLDALRDRSDPFSMSVGNAVHPEVGLTDLRRTFGRQEYNDTTIELKEFREIQVSEMSATPATSGTANVDQQPGAEGDSSSGTAPAQPNRRNRVNLNDQGLRPGDRIDPYLKDHAASNTELTAAPATYEFDGTGMPNRVQNFSLVAGQTEGRNVTGIQSMAPELPVTQVSPDGGSGGNQEDVTSRTEPGSSGSMLVLKSPDGHANTAAINVTGGGQGSFYIENVSFRGRFRAKGPRQANLHIGVTDQESSAVLRNVTFPDGGYPGAASGIGLDQNHSGTLYLDGVSASKYPNSAVSGQAPGNTQDEGGGRVIVTRSRFENNGVASLHLAGPSTIVSESIIVNNQRPPKVNESATPYARGIWIDGYSPQTRIENVTITQTVPGIPIELGRSNKIPSGGIVTGARITNAMRTPPIKVVTGNWQGNNNTFNGEGNRQPVGGTFNRAQSQPLASDALRLAAERPALQSPEYISQLAGGRETATSGTSAGYRGRR